MKKGRSFLHDAEGFSDPDPIFDGEPTFKADRDAVHALMKFVNAIAEPSDEAHSPRAMRATQRWTASRRARQRAEDDVAAGFAFLARLTRELEKAKLYDEYGELVYL